MKDQENLFESGNSNKNDTAVTRYSTHIRNLCKLTSFLKRKYKKQNLQVQPVNNLCICLYILYMLLLLHVDLFFCDLNIP